ALDMHNLFIGLSCELLEQYVLLIYRKEKGRSFCFALFCCVAFIANLVVGQSPSGTDPTGNASF
ncbi:MAG: hypothetical protein COS29_02745, partial [Candidatus Omnitrophica bacterium CG02_land_8_20_14_3_00__42_8]